MDFTERTNRMATNFSLNAAVATLDYDEKKALVCIIKELREAKKKHLWPQDIIYQGAIVAEESGELTKATLELKEGKGNHDQVVLEATQVGATAIRMLSNNLDKELRTKDQSLKTKD